MSQRHTLTCCCLPAPACLPPAAAAAATATCCSRCPARLPSQPYVARCERSCLLLRLTMAVNLLLLLVLSLQGPMTPGAHSTAVKGCLKA